MPGNLSAHRAPEHLRLILRQVPGVIWATDRDLCLTYIHGQLMRPDGPESQRSLIGTTVYEFLESQDPTEPGIAHHLAALSGGKQSFQYVYRGRWFEVLIEPLRSDSGDVMGCVGAAIDVTGHKDAKESLARSEARLVEAQRVAHVGSFEWDGCTNHMTWSDELCRIYGLAGGESSTTFDDFLAMVHDEDESRVRSIIFDAYRDPKPFAYHNRIVKPDGRIRVLQTAGDVITGADGSVKVVGSCWDITTQHETMEKLRRTISLLEATLAATADGILVVDNEQRVAAYNQRFLELWRVPPSLAARRDEAALLAYVADQLEDPQGFIARVQQLYASPDEEAFDQVHFKDGRVFERFSNLQRVNDRVVGRVWSFRDITDRERLLVRTTFLADATRLLASLDFRKALGAVARLAVPYLGACCAVDLIQNDRPERLVSAGSTDHGERWPELHPATLAGHASIYTAGSRSHMAVPLTCRNTVVGAITCVAHPDHHYEPEDLDLIEELGRRTALSIDNARLYEAAREALNRRDEFLSVAAHEIRGPLTSIHLAVQSLLRGTLSSPMAQTALNVIQNEDRRLVRFVEELLDFGRIQTGRLHFELEEIDIGTVVRDVVSRLSADAAGAGSGVTVQTTGNLVGQWDRFRLEQVVTNLLSNAIKYGNGQPIDIIADGTENSVTLTIVDRGIGIEPSMLTRIFDPFQRAVSARHYGGLGLGLHISRTIVEGLGGTISADSRPGEGSTFTVLLPVSR